MESLTKSLKLTVSVLFAPVEELLLILLSQRWRKQQRKEPPEQSKKKLRDFNIIKKKLSRRLKPRQKLEKSKKKSKRKKLSFKRRKKWNQLLQLLPSVSRTGTNMANNIMKIRPSPWLWKALTSKLNKPMRI